MLRSTESQGICAPAAAATRELRVLSGTGAWSRGGLERGEAGGTPNNACSVDEVFSFEPCDASCPLVPALLKLPRLSVVATGSALVDPD